MGTICKILFCLFAYHIIRFLNVFNIYIFYDDGFAEAYIYIYSVGERNIASETFNASFACFRREGIRQ